MTNPVITFTKVTKKYPSYQHVSGGIKEFIFNFPRSMINARKKYTALEEICFSINKGETFGVIGRNGAGKSTLLGLIAGVILPESGKIIIEGRVSPMLELGSGFHHELSGRENIILNGILLGLTKKQVMDKLESIIEFSELGDHINQPVRTYSSGMLSKLGFSVVSHLEPQIILLDEVLAVGDMVFAKKCINKIQEYRNDPDVTVVLVSHDLQQVEEICDRAMWIEKTRVNMVGKSSDVIQAYKNKYS